MQAPYKRQIGGFDSPSPYQENNMDNKKETTVWVSRDVGKDFLKVWGTEPYFQETNQVFLVRPNREYLGYSCLEKWPGPEIKEGEKLELKVSFTPA